MVTANKGCHLSSKQTKIQQTSKRPYTNLLHNLKNKGFKELMPTEAIDYSL